MLRAGGGLLAGVTLGLAVLGAVALATARGALDRGAGAAQAALVSARAGRLAVARQELHDSQADLRAGIRRLNVWWARPAADVPVEGANLRAAGTMATSAETLVATADQLLTTASGPVTVEAGKVPVDRIDTLEAPTANASKVVLDAGKRLDRARSPLLLPPIASRLGWMRTEVGKLAANLQGLIGAERLSVDLLGGTSPEPGQPPPAPGRYFVAFTTPSELRGATGLIANYGEIDIQGGQISLTRFGRMEDLARQAPVTPSGLGWNPQFVTTYGAILTGALWQNVTISPDFPAAAAAIEALYPRSGGDAVNGVVAIDPEGLSALLELEGPIVVSGWPTEIDAANVASVLEHDQYNRFPDLDRRVAFLADLTTQIVDRLNHPRVIDVFQLAAAVEPALRGKHIILASSKPGEEALLQRFGVAGALPTQVDDVLGVFSVNASTNKTDWYLKRQVNYAVTLTPTSIRATVTVTLSNQAPSAGQAAAVLQGTPGIAPPGHNRQILTFLTPWSFVGATVDSTSMGLDEATIDGMHLYSVMIDIPPGRAEVVQLALTGLRHRHDYQLEVVQQPTAHPDVLQVQASQGAKRLWSASSTVASNLHFG